MKAQAFLSRLPAGAPDELADTINLAFGVSDRYAAKVASIKSDRNLTVAGMAQQIAAARNGGFGEHFGQLRKTVKDGLENARLERSRLSLPPLDKSDLAGASWSAHERAHESGTKRS